MVSAVGKATVTVGSTGVTVGKTGKRVCVAVGVMTGSRVGVAVAGNGVGVLVGVGEGVRVRVGVTIVVRTGVGDNRGVVGVEATGLSPVGVGCGLVAVGGVWRAYRSNSSRCGVVCRNRSRFPVVKDTAVAHQKPLGRYCAVLCVAVWEVAVRGCFSRAAPWGFWLTGSEVTPARLTTVREGIANAPA